MALWGYESLPTMQDTTANNKRIAKNTLLLYFRMFLIMGVSLYTSRVILDALGVEDFGVYNVVGGVVAMMGFLNGAMSSASSRFITFELGRGDQQKLHHVFCVSVNVQALLALLVLLLTETVGLWYFYEKLVVPAERLESAFWVYQCSVLSMVVMIMSVPYNAAIIAHEKMSAFAYISVIEVVLKLAIVFLLTALPADKLVMYAVLLLLVQIVIRSCYTIYCKRHFAETHYRWMWDKQLTREISSFAVFSFWGNFAVLMYSHGINLLLNAFFGPVVNAARAVTVQVQGNVMQFVRNFQTALNPQIVKSYAVGDMRSTFDLVYRSARFSFFLMLMLSLPLALEADVVLGVWLKVVPCHTVIFLRITMLIGLVFTLINPLVILAQATGKIIKYQLIEGGTLLLIVPVSYVCLWLGMPAYSVYIVHFCIETITLFVRLLLLREIVGLSVSGYLRRVCIPVVCAAAVSCVCPVVAYLYLPRETLLGFIGVCSVCVVSVSLSVVSIGLSASERSFIFSKIRDVMRHFRG